MEYRDGRDTRWQEHRVERRATLVDSALRAIRTHGAAVTIDEIALGAGTSKTVLYRYFGDRNGLYLAMADKVASNILSEVRPRFESLRESGEVADLVRGLADAYIGLVDRDPDIYLFVMNRPPSLPQAWDPRLPDPMVPGGPPNGGGTRGKNPLVHGCCRGRDAATLEP